MQTAPRPTSRRLAGRAAVVFAATAATFLAAAPQPTRAAIYTWTGTGGSANWDAYTVLVAGGISFYTSNWGTGIAPIVPTSSATTSLVFGSATGPKTLNNNLANPFTLNAITVASGADAYTIGGNALAFAANGGTAPTLVTDATSAETVNAPILVKDDLNVTVASTGDLSLTGRLTGTSAGLTKAGDGALVLTGGTDANPSTLAHLQVGQGPVTLSGGALDLTDTGATGFGGTSSLFVGSWLTINNGVHVTAAATPHIHNGGVIVVDGAGSNLHVVPAPGAPAEMRVGYAGSTSYLQAQNGGSVTVDGDMRLGNAPFNGRGILDALDGGSVSVAGTLTLDGATDSLVSIAGGTVTVGGLASADSTAPRIFLADPANGIALTVGANDLSSSFNGQIHGSGSLQKTGAGTLTLSGQSDYTGLTRLSGGTLRLGADNALPAASPLIFTAFADATLDLNNHNQTVSRVITESVFGTISLGAGTLTIGGTGNPNSAISALVQDGPAGTGGKLVFNGGSAGLGHANTFTGGTTLTGGAVLSIAQDASLGAPPAPLTLAGGTLLVVAPLTSARPVAVTANSTFYSNFVTSTFSGAFSGTANLDVAGKGTLVLAGATGTLGSLSTNWTDPASLILDAANLTLTASGSTGFGGTSSLFAPDAGAPITIRNGTHLTTTGYPQLHNAASLTVDGPTTVWTNADPAPGTAGQIRVGYAGGTSTLAVGNGATVNTTNLMVGDAYFDQNPGVGAVTISGGGHVNVADELWVMNGSTLAVDRASVSAGDIADWQPNGKPLASISLTDPAGAPGTALILNDTGRVGIFNGPITDGPNGPGGITVNGTGWHFLYNASYSGPTTVNGGNVVLANNTHNGSFTVNAGASLFLQRAALNPGTKSLTANAGGTIYYDTVTINGGFLRGAGTHYFSGGAVSVNGSTLLPGTHVTQSSTTTLTNVTSSAAITNSTTLTWDGGYNTAAGSLNVYSTANTDLFENDGAITVYSGAILSNTQSNLVSGGGSSVTVSPGGFITLNSTSLELHAAALVNNGNITGGPTLVYANSTAKGSGTFGPVQLLSGGTFSPGNSPGSVTTGDATWSAGGTYLFELSHTLGTPGSDWDLWNVDGSLTLAATPTDPFFIDIAPYNLPDFNPASSYHWLLATVTRPLNNFDPSAIVLRPEGVCLCDGSYALTQSNGNLYLNYVPAVPEPATLALLALLALPAATRRTRRRRH